MSIWSINICGFDYRLKMPRNKDVSSETRQSILVLRNEGYSTREIAKKLKISYNAMYYSLHRKAQTGSIQNRKRSERPRCTTEQEDKYIRVSSLRNRCLTGPQVAASLNSTCKTPVSISTVKRRLQDTGLPGFSLDLGTLLWSHFHLDT
jgi:transposase